MPDLRRYQRAIEVVAAFSGAALAGLLLMAPIDVVRTGQGPALQMDLLVMNVPRAAAAGAVLAVVTAALAVVLGVRAAWITALGSAALLLTDHLWDRDAVATGTLTTVNYIDAIFSGTLLGALAVAALRKPASALAYLAGALASIVFGDLTSLPAAEDIGSSLIEWASGDTPPLWLVLLAVVSIALATAAHRRESVPLRSETADLPLGPIAAGLLVITSTSFAAEWIARHAVTVPNIAGVVVITTIVVSVAALLLPGRDGTLVLLAVAVANAGSAIVAVPRPDWSMPIPIVVVAAGLWLGRRWPTPWAGLAASAGLALFAAATTTSGHVDAVVAVVGVVAVSAVIGYCFGAVTPRAVPSSVLAITVLVVPCVVVGLRGNSFGRVAYSPQWFRDPSSYLSSAPAWAALAITAGCAIGLWALRALRPERVQEPTSTTT
ncbi:hypothetical protein HLB23_10790 [Nocardia uniformis]|uniref:Uncharacterized protein n=1 Tax=Nocardia uniformis TaxID=53432 RepID=A0A849C1X9_9NOCA|nr:hypothetical protein [Nocardia uniformis]NNH70345.1 hypothetical protein [Nocardia uniformis]